MNWKFRKTVFEGTKTIGLKWRIWGFDEKRVEVFGSSALPPVALLSIIIASSQILSFNEFPLTRASFSSRFITRMKEVALINY